jgi:hypothetical protein
LSLNPPARGLPQLAFHATCLHGCCGGNRLRHTLAGEWPVLRAQTCCMRTGLLVGPLGGTMDPLVGRCWAMVPLDLHLCLINHTHVPRARCVTYIGVRAVGGRVVCEAGAVRGRWSGRDTKPADALSNSPRVLCTVTVGRPVGQLPRRSGFEPQIWAQRQKNTRNRN